MKYIINNDGETPRKQKLENSNSEEVRGFQNTHMTAEIDEACVELIKCFEVLLNN